MTRTTAIGILLLTACSQSQPPPVAEVPLRFRAIREGQNPSFCVEGPDFAAAFDEGSWIDVFDRQTSCRAGDVELPALDFDRRFALVAWWRVEGCVGFDVRADAVVLRGDEVIVRAGTTSPRGACESPPGGLESFLSVERAPGVEGATRARFFLDGAETGSIPLR